MTTCTQQMYFSLIRDLVRIYDNNTNRQDMTVYVQYMTLHYGLYTNFDHL